MIAVVKVLQINASENAIANYNIHSWEMWKIGSTKFQKGNKIIKYLRILYLS